MKQPIKKNSSIKGKVHKVTTNKKSSNRSNRHHPKYGTSKLEEDFAHNFLDKLGVEYQYQFEAKEIGRYFDFYLNKSNIIIEVDGDYW